MSLKASTSSPTSSSLRFVTQTPKFLFWATWAAVRASSATGTEMTRWRREERTNATTTEASMTRAVMAAFFFNRVRRPRRSDWR